MTQMLQRWRLLYKMLVIVNKILKLPRDGIANRKMRSLYFGFYNGIFKIILEAENGNTIESGK
jgi:hypothetical protein